MQNVPVALIATSLCLAPLIVGCGSPASTCPTSNCSLGTKTYRVCSHSDGTVDYERDA